MAMNRIQFQPGLSMPEFFSLFGTEALCASALESARWPDGFRCPDCGGAAHCILHSIGNKVFQCNACRHQTSLIAGTVFQSTKLPLTIWFLAIYLVSQAKTGLSALALKRQLGVSYPTAWLMQHKLMQAMTEREALYTLSGKVQVDDAYLGGERKQVARSDAAPRTRWPLWRRSPSLMRATLCESNSARCPVSSSEPSQTGPKCLAAGSTVYSDGLACPIQRPWWTQAG